jgi:two-component system sensor histidine kinase ResE
MLIWKSVVGKLWMTIIALVALVLMILGFFLLEYIDTYFANSNDVKRLFIYTSIIGFSLTTFFAFFLSTKITQPLLQLKKAADSITQGEYSARVRVHSTDEIGQLAQTFNHMVGQLEETIKDLNYEKEHLGSVLRSMTDAVITFDAAGKVILANPQGEKIIQEWSAISWNEEDRTVSSARQIPEPLHSLFDAVVMETKELTSKLHVHNGVWSVVMTPLYTQEMVRGAVAVLREVTEEHRLDKLRKDFVANVSHELRTPLSMLQGYSEALIDDIAGSAEERRELAQIILDESMRMGRLVENLLDLASMEAGHLRMNCHDVNLSSLISRVTRKFSARAKEHQIHLEHDMKDSNLMIHCADEDRLEQVLTNLIENAIRHTPEDASIVIRGSQVEYKKVKAIHIEIEDQGTGIPAEDLTYIFERFYKADKARTRMTTGGTGLGLAIVKNIVEAHDGSVFAQSEVGQGTTFSFIIPCDSALRKQGNPQ